MHNNFETLFDSWFSPLSFNVHSMLRRVTCSYLCCAPIERGHLQNRISNCLLNLLASLEPWLFSLNPHGVVSQGQSPLDNLNSLVPVHGVEVRLLVLPLVLVVVVVLGQLVVVGHQDVQQAQEGEPPAEAKCTWTSTPSFFSRKMQEQFPSFSLRLEIGSKIAV